jgi:alanine dehydrogenase
MLVLSNDEIEQLVSVEDCMVVLEQAYRALAAGRANNTPRIDSLIPHPTQPDAVYSFKQMGGVVWEGVQALRINSDVIHWPQVHGTPRRVKIPAAHGHWVGLVFLFDPATGIPLAIFPDGVVQHLRVGATNGLAARYLAPPGARRMALLGTGWQAETQLLAIVAATGVEEVRVYSPTPGHVEQFCEKMGSKVAARLVPTSSAEQAVQGASVVAAATNTMRPVLDPSWIEPGRHFSTIKTQEVGPEFVARVRPYLHTRRQAKAEVLMSGEVPRLEAEAGWWQQPEVNTWPDLSDLASGKIPGRTDPQAVTLFVNNVGMGLQFAAVGRLVLERARAAGVGHQLPDEWFLQTVHP